MTTYIATVHFIKILCIKELLYIVPPGLVLRKQSFFLGGGGYIGITLSVNPCFMIISTKMMKRY